MSSAETILVSKDEYNTLKEQVKLLKNSRLYKRLLEFEQNIAKGGKFYRADLGF